MGFTFHQPKITLFSQKRPVLQYPNYWFSHKCHVIYRNTVELYSFIVVYKGYWLQEKVSWLCELDTLFGVSQSQVHGHTTYKRCSDTTTLVLMYSTLKTPFDIVLVFT